MNGPNVELHKSLTIAAFPTTTLVAMMELRILVSQVHHTPSIGRVHLQSRCALRITNHTAEHGTHDLPTENRSLSTCPPVSDSDVQASSYERSGDANVYRGDAANGAATKSGVGLTERQPILQIKKG